MAASAMARKALCASLLLGAASGHRAHPEAALLEQVAGEEFPPHRLAAPLFAATAASGLVPPSPLRKDGRPGHRQVQRGLVPDQDPVARKRTPITREADPLPRSQTGNFGIAPDQQDLRRGYSEARPQPEEPPAKAPATAAGGAPRLTADQRELRRSFPAAGPELERPAGFAGGPLAPDQDGPRRAKEPPARAPAKAPATAAGGAPGLTADQRELRRSFPAAGPALERPAGFAGGPLAPDQDGPRRAKEPRPSTPVARPAAASRSATDSPGTGAPRLAVDQRELRRSFPAAGPEVERPASFAGGPIRPDQDLQRRVMYDETVVEVGFPPAAKKGVEMPASWKEKLLPDSLEQLTAARAGPGRKRMGRARLAAQPEVEVTFSVWDRKDGGIEHYLRMAELLRDTGFVPKVYATADFEDLLLVASENPQGRRLSDFISEAAKTKKMTSQAELLVPLERSLPLIVDLLTSLAALERAGAVDGNLAEQNLYLVDGERHLMTGDISVACVPKVDGQAASWVVPEATTLPAAFRQAPEMTKGASYTVASNVWQGGLVCASLLLGGVMPAELLDIDMSFAAGRQQVRQYVREEYSVSIAPGFAALAEQHGDIAAIVEGMLEKDPAKRLTAQAALAAAQAAARDRGIDAEPVQHLAPAEW